MLNKIQQFLFIICPYCKTKYSKFGFKFVVGCGDANHTFTYYRRFTKKEIKFVNYNLKYQSFYSKKKNDSYSVLYLFDKHNSIIQVIENVNLEISDPEFLNKISNYLLFA